MDTSPSTGSQPTSFRADIEGLRGVAILLVIGFHLGVPGLSGGYVGVDVFFVLSGYLITGLMVTEIDQTGRLAFVEFYARRARRLLPAAALVLVVTLLLAALLYSPLEMLEVGRTAQTVAVYGSNLWFARSSVDYLGPDTDVDPLLHTWSLGVEEQFYFLWPIAIVLMMTIGRSSRLRARRLFVGMALIVAGSFALSVVLTARVQPWAFYTSPPRFWEFGIGAFAAIIPTAIGRRVTQTTAFAVVCLLLVLGTAMTYDAFTSFPGWAASLPVLGTAGLLRAGASSSTTIIARGLTNPGLMWLGRHSYSWYLWHWPLVVFAAVVWPDPPLWLTAAAGLIALACAVAMFRWLEHPVRVNGWLRARPKISIAVGLALAATGLVAGQGLRSYAGRLSERPEQQRFARASTDQPRIYREGCTAGFLDTSPAQPCVFGAVDETTTIVLFGDSHAAQWFPAVERLAVANHWRLIVRVKAACPTPALDTLYSARLHRVYSECSSWRRKTIAEIVALRPVLTIMSNASAYVGRAHDGSRVSLEAWRAGLVKTLAVLRAANVPTVLLADPSIPGFDVPICLSRADAALLGGRPCGFGTAARLAHEVRAVEAAAMSNGGHLVDLNDQICAEAHCDTDRDGTVIYSDSNHLAASFSETLAPALIARIRALGL